MTRGSPTLVCEPRGRGAAAEASVMLTDLRLNNSHLKLVPTALRAQAHGDGSWLVPWGHRLRPQASKGCKVARRAAAGCKVAGCKAARCKAAGSKLCTARLQAKMLSSMNRYTSRVPAFAANETIISSEKQGATRPTDRLTERQTTRLRQTDRQKNKQTTRQTNRLIFM